MSLPLIPLPSRISETGGAPLRLPAGPSSTRDEALGIALSSSTVADDDSLAAEAYRLRVDADGVGIEAAGEAGAFYAAQTLRQLLERDERGWLLRPLDIHDAPRFAHRGVMLDVARHFHPVETVTWLVDRIAELKFNSLHLHLTDDQGWRIELRSRPELTARASATGVGGDGGGFYTREDWRTILDHAASRHIVVVPEIDVPGHTHAVGLAHPELACDPVITDAVRETSELFGDDLPVAGAPYTGIAVGFSSLRAGDPAVADFLRDVLGELAELTPGPWLHLGGDEAHGTDPADYAWLVSLAAGIVAEHGKTVVAWHEAGSAPLPAGAVGQFWGFTKASDEIAEKTRAFAANGGKVVLSPADAIYLDMKYDESTPLGLVWADGPTSVERSYRWDPSRVVPGLDEQDILGVEAALWTETIRTRADIERMAFPRVAAAAELAWSPAADEAGQRGWPAFRRRLAALGTHWSDAGIGFERADGVDWADRSSPA